MTGRSPLGLDALLGGYLALAVGVGLGVAVAVAPEVGVLAFLFALAVGFLTAGAAMIAVMAVLDVRHAGAARPTS